MAASTSRSRSAPASERIVPPSKAATTFFGLGLLLGRLRPLGGDALQGSRQQLHVMPVRPVHRHPDRYPVAFGGQAAFDPTLSSVGRVGSGFFPRPKGPWSSRRPPKASPSRCRRALQSVVIHAATAVRTSHRRPIRETDRGRWSRGTDRCGPAPSTGSRCAARKRSHPRTSDPPSSAARHPSGGYLCVPAAAAPTQPTAHRRSESRWWSCCSAFFAGYVLKSIAYPYAKDAQNEVELFG